VAPPRPCAGIHSGRDEEGSVKRYYTVVDEQTGEILASIDIESREVITKKGIVVHADNYEPVLEVKDSTVSFLCHDH
jgi:hypothetical protein